MSVTAGAEVGWHTKAEVVVVVVVVVVVEVCVCGGVGGLVWVGGGRVCAWMGDLSILELVE